MSDDILEIKPAWGPFHLNLNALLRRMRREPRGAAHTVAARFLQLFADHGVKPAQIPRLLPSLPLAALASETTLLAALTPGLLDQAAQLFGIQRAWLEVATERLYRTHSCYKRPAVLFDLLRQLPFSRGEFQLRALTSVEHLYGDSGRPQPLALVVVEKLFPVDYPEEIWDIERYHVFGDAWDWSHFPCRIQLKAMARVIDQRGQPVPLHRVKPAELKAVLEGRCVPKPFVNRCLLTDPSLEDYACSRTEHAQAKETAELAAVMEYLENQPGAPWLPA